MIYLAEEPGEKMQFSALKQDTKLSVEINQFTLKNKTVTPREPKSIKDILLKMGLV